MQMLFPPFVWLGPPVSGGSISLPEFSGQRTANP